MKRKSAGFFDDINLQFSLCTCLVDVIETMLGQCYQDGEDRASHVEIRFSRTAVNARIQTRRIAPSNQAR